MTGRRSDRDGFAEVGVSMREAIDRALSDPSASNGQLRMLLAVIRETGSSSRLWDERHRSQLAKVAGVSERTGSRALVHLDAAGVIEWRPGHRNVPSRVGLPGSASQIGGPLKDHLSGTSRRPAEHPFSEPSGEPQRARSDHFSETPGVPLQEKGFHEEEQQRAAALGDLVNQVAGILLSLRPKFVERARHADNPDAYRAGALRREAGRIAEQVATLHATDPELTADAIADRLAPGGDTDQQRPTSATAPRRTNHCEPCHGTAYTLDDPATPCAACRGTGKAAAA